MRRPIVDFYHLFDEDDLFSLKLIVLIVKRIRFDLGVATKVRSNLGVAAKVRNPLQIATVVRSKVQG